ncbi:MAG: DNA methyltransferase, partial [Desulfobulbia bacterium]
MNPDYEQDNIKLYNADCMEVMKQYEDDYFDLSIVDCPYGIDHATKAGKQANTQYGNACAPKNNYTVKEWDKYEPDGNYFKELFRVSKNQIIWGANYYPQHLFKSMGWIVWDKDNGENGFSDCELAFTSFNKGLRKFKYTWNGIIQGDMKNKENRIHP